MNQSDAGAQREHSSAYIVQDRSNLDEMRRLEIQDTILTAGMGGVLPELADPLLLQRILDVGCGTGGWLIETAKTYPTIERLYGGDVSATMLSYAQKQAEASHLGERIAFQQMDALRIIEFPASSFDLVNQRLGASWIRTWEWKKLLLEYQRVLRPGGIARITEMHGFIESNSPALTQLGEMSMQVFCHSGRLFTPTPDGLTGQLAHLLTVSGFENIRTHLHRLVLRAGTLEGHSLQEDIAIGYQVAFPFFQRWTRVPRNYDEIYQQALIEMQQSDFVATWALLTVCATTPMQKQHFLMRGLP